MARWAHKPGNPTPPTPTPHPATTDWSSGERRTMSKRRVRALASSRPSSLACPRHTKPITGARQDVGNEEARHVATKEESKWRGQG